MKSNVEECLQSRDTPDVSSDSSDPSSRQPNPGEISAQVDKLLASPTFQHSVSARRLLAFLATWSTDHPGQAVKEIELAMSVYDLTPEKFDPQLDSTVRVKVGRLRAKIHEYYANYGLQDEIVLEIPKGSYCLLSHYRNAAQTPANSVPEIAAPIVPDDDAIGEPSPSAFLSYRQGWSKFIVILLLGILLGGIGTFSWFRVTDRTNRVPDHLKQFWSEMSGNPQPILAVFSNPRLTGVLAHGGLHYFQDEADSKSAPPGNLNLGYAGAGDVQSIHELTRLFDRLHRDLQVESGALLAWDTAKDANLIFIGRPEQNPALSALPRLREFYFKYDLGIVNAHPQPGEAGSYAYSQPDNYDYAVIAFIPGIHPLENTLVLAGNTTWGSLAAMEFMTKDQSVVDLLSRLHVKPGQKIPYFEALLKVRINNSIPVWSTILAIRPHPTDSSSWESPKADER